jgi:hypothetical protein
VIIWREFNDEQHSFEEKRNGIIGHSAKKSSFDNQFYGKRK